MKIFVKMSIIVVIFLAFCLPVSANDAESYIAEFDEILPDDFKGRVDTEGKISDIIGFRSLLYEIACAFDERRGEILSFLLLLLGGVALSCVASMLEGELASACEAGIGCIFSLLVFSRIAEIFTEVSEGLSNLSAFFAAFIPIAASATAASGGVSTALVQHSGMNITLWLLSTVGNPIFTSVVGFGIAVSLLCAFGDDNTLALARSVKSFFVFCVGTVSAILGATLSLQTAISSAADGAAIRAARYAATGFIPVVGAAVSGALSTLVSGLTYAKSIIGAGGVAVILITSISPLLMLLLYRLCVLCAAFFAEHSGRRGAVGIVSAVKFSLDSMIALYTSSALVYIIEIVMFMKGGVSG